MSYRLPPPVCLTVDFLFMSALAKIQWVSLLSTGFPDPSFCVFLWPRIFTIPRLPGHPALFKLTISLCM